MASPDNRNLHEDSNNSLKKATNNFNNFDNVPAILRAWGDSYGAEIAGIIVQLVFGCLSIFFTKKILDEGGASAKQI